MESNNQPLIKEDTTVTVTIDNIEYAFPEGITILEAARMVSIDIPSLCYLKDINEIGMCRVCVVDVEGNKNLQASCVYPVFDGLKVKTNSQRVINARKTAISLILSNHHRECLTCIRNLNCELQNMADNLGVREIPYEYSFPLESKQNDNPAIVRDYNKCIKCRRCMSICETIQTCNVYDVLDRGINTKITPAFGFDMGTSTCIMCGQCVLACPTASLTEAEEIDDVLSAIYNPDKHVIVQTAPSIQVTLGEIFGIPLGTIVSGKMVTALKMIGFDKVFATDVTADLTIMEEASELIDRITNNPEHMPLLSSCCPAWVKFAEHFYPEFLSNLSSCKSPHEMFGALSKTWYAEKSGINPKNIINVAIMPCTAKKYETCRPEMSKNGYKDVDYVLTTRELGRVIRRFGINFSQLPDAMYDAPFDQHSGAGMIFGSTGGVLEAALRTAHKLITGNEMPQTVLTDSQRQTGLKYEKVSLGDKELVVAVAHGCSNARKALESYKSGDIKFDYMEVMACPGGCVGGGGQPILGGRDHHKISLDYRHNRADSLFQAEKGKPLRRSHENIRVQQIYDEYLGKPLSEKSKELLHTTFTPRSDVPQLDIIDD